MATAVHIQITLTSLVLKDFMSSKVSEANFGKIEEQLPKKPVGRSLCRGMGRKGKREGDWGERERDACCKNLFLFISVDAGIRKFLIG